MEHNSEETALHRSGFSSIAPISNSGFCLSTILMVKGRSSASLSSVTPFSSPTAARATHAAVTCGRLLLTRHHKRSEGRFQSLRAYSVSRGPKHNRRCYCYCVPMYSKALRKNRMLKTLSNLKGQLNPSANQQHKQANAAIHVMCERCLLRVTSATAGLKCRTPYPMYMT